MQFSTLLLVALVVSVSAFAPLLKIPHRSNTILHAYVPDGLSSAEYAAIKKKEKVKNGGRSGPRGFESRSMSAFQEAMERGEATHLMPTMYAKERLASGELKLEDIPYMQRGGSWDNTDVKGAKKRGTVKKWAKRDKEYAATDIREKSSVSIFGGANMPWTGKEGFSNAMNQKGASKNNFAAKESERGSYDPAYNPNGAKQRTWGRPTVDVVEKKTWANQKKKANGNAVNGKAVNGFSWGKKAPAAATPVVKSGGFSWGKKAPAPEPVVEKKKGFFGF